MTEQVKVLTSRWEDNRAHDIDRYGELDGYASLDTAFDTSPEDSPERRQPVDGPPTGRVADGGAGDDQSSTAPPEGGEGR